MARKVLIHSSKEPKSKPNKKKLLTQNPIEMLQNISPSNPLALTLIKPKGSSRNFRRNINPLIYEPDYKPLSKASLRIKLSDVPHRMFPYPEFCYGACTFCGRKIVVDRNFPKNMQICEVCYHKGSNIYGWKKNKDKEIVINVPT